MERGDYEFQAALEDNKREYRQLASSFNRLSARRCRLLEQVLEMSYRGGSEVVVFVTPTHPELLEYLQATTQYRDRCRQVAQFLAGESAKYGFRFVPLDTISDFAGDPHQFVDGIHPLEPNTRRMVDQILRRPQMAYPYVVQ
jgi:hypothetical protein